jgi:hypothetical protein
MAFWDFLRPITNYAVGFDAFTRVLVLILSIALFVVSVLAYRRTKSRKLMFVTIAFFLFAAEWSLMVSDIFLSPGDFFHRAAGNLFELGVLICLFMAIFKK